MAWTVIDIARSEQERRRLLDTTSVNDAQEHAGPDDVASGTLAPDPRALG
jgi:hypothetical protein